MTVAVIGLGIMGGAYCRNLIRAGETVLGVDPSQIGRQALLEAGGRVFETPGKWIADCDAVILALASPQALFSVCNVLSELLRAGQIVIETGTFSLEDKQAARAVLERSGVDVLDCPVSGTGAQAADADLVMMASGDEDAIVRAVPLLEKFTRLVMNVGAFGNGTKLKFVANHAVAVHNVAAAETLSYCDALGLDRETVYQLLSSGAGQSRMSDLRMPMMMTGVYEPPTASLRMFEKDLRIIGNDIAAKGVSAPLFEASRSIYENALRELPEGLDTASVFEVYRARAGKN
ncbi:NAD(P)-dependent oxidoreductase [uncultured Roseibium sp.]|uniref:NAD(P)-dependent oxidoreductase n=1 Tax=uncultured Roseibium sp. TaxID=1936171 RepID=UPI002637CC17|nr:NAD(P)-dependent oxidoreductase [uncultured Roseibium sp.]